LKKHKDDNKEFIKTYNSSVYEKPNTSVDTAIFTVYEGKLCVLTVKRDEPPFKDAWTLVGGFIDINHDIDLESTAMRKLTEKTGVSTPYLEQFGTVGNKTRDPRGWSVTTVYFALIPHNNVKFTSRKGASDIKWAAVNKGKIKNKLGFDHAAILKACSERLRSKVLYTSLPVHLMSGPFTLGELQKTYEIILEKKIDHKSFRRRILAADIIEETHNMRREGTRPAQLYQLRDKHASHFFTRTMEGAN
tara:strand:+ start:1239 stop:1979 length:741 start_codon:yes stop_codon:yes gene_type:complete